MIVRNFKYRLYPTDAQRVILNQWEGTLRFLWNLCHEQRKMGYARPKGERKYPTLHDQQKEMTQLLGEYPWIAEVQCQARQEVLHDLDTAWKSVWKGLSKNIWFKGRGHPMRICIPVATVPFTLAGDRLTGKIEFKSPQYRKLGTLKLVYDRPLKGTIKSWNLKRDGDEWYAIACCHIEHETPPQINDKVIGIDRGVVHPIADSDEITIDNPHFLQSLERKIVRAQREVERKDKGSKNQHKARKKVAKLHRLVARRREVFLNTESKHYAENYGTVVIENLQVANMTASASGTIEEPGTNISQKSGLNKAILDVGWGMFGQQLAYKTEERGGKLIKVDPKNTSQQCSCCGFTDSDNRPDQATFRCQSCGYESNADINAAKNIKQRGLTAPLPKKAVQKISIPRRKPKDEKTAVKPTVVQSVEDTSLEVR